MRWRQPHIRWPLFLKILDALSTPESKAELAEPSISVRFSPEIRTPDPLTLAVVLLTTLPCAENVGSQFHSLRHTPPV